MPTRHAGLRPGETALDLDCGAGNDVFLARHEVGETDRLKGVDTTSEPIARVRANARKLGFDDVEFRLGEIEHLPVESGTFGCVISNCASNLVPDEARALAEIARVSKPGGRLCVFDIVATGELLRRSARPRPFAWVGWPGRFPGRTISASPRRPGSRRSGSARPGRSRCRISCPPRIATPRASPPSAPRRSSSGA